MSILGCKFLLDVQCSSSISFQNKSPLHGISWLRIVLDEGHIIRNPNAQMSKAVLGLKAQRRWILSGIVTHTDYNG